MSEDPSNTNRAYAAITSVNAAGTSATFTVNTAGWTAGKYDVWADQSSESVGPPADTCPTLTR